MHVSFKLHSQFSTSLPVGYLICPKFLVFEPIVKHEHWQKGINSSPTTGLTPCSGKAGGNEKELNSQARDEQGRETAGSYEVLLPSPSLASWGPSVRRLFSQYIFFSLVHNSNLNKRFELQSRLTQHILWAMTAICVKKIKKERACWHTWAGMTESEAERRLRQQAGS